jgi:ribosomal protein S18 acetylase RimI-like enzyme
MVASSKNNKVTSYTYEGKNNLLGAKNFNSGNQAIDKFAKSNLRAHAKAPGNAVTVLLDNDNNQTLVGYVTIVAHTLSRNELTESEHCVGKTPQIPVVKLNMLGVSLNYQKQGYGESLMQIAFTNAKIVCNTIGCSGLYLEADPDAVSFYDKLGFESLSNPDPHTGIVPMFLHINSIP